MVAYVISSITNYYAKLYGNFKADTVNNVTLSDGKDFEKRTLRTEPPKCFELNVDIYSITYLSFYLLDKQEQANASPF